MSVTDTWQPKRPGPASDRDNVTTGGREATVCDDQRPLFTSNHALRKIESMLRTELAAAAAAAAAAAPPPPPQAYHELWYHRDFVASLQLQRKEANDKNTELAASWKAATPKKQKPLLATRTSPRNRHTPYTRFASAAAADPRANCSTTDAAAAAADAAACTLLFFNILPI